MCLMCLCLIYVFKDEWSDKASQNSSTFDDGGSAGDIDSEHVTTAFSKPKKQPKVANVAARRKDHLNIVFIGHVGRYSSVTLLKVIS